MQKDLMEPGRQLQRSQTLISKEGLEKMGKELVRLCDGIERHGLVDYQYGVWEQQIIESKHTHPLCLHPGKHGGCKY